MGCNSSIEKTSRPSSPTCSYLQTQKSSGSNSTEECTQEKIQRTQKTLEESILVLKSKKTKHSVPILDEKDFKQEFPENLVKMGSGGAGTVYNGVSSKDKQKYAIKYQYTMSEDTDNLVSELENIAQLEKHKNILDYFAFYIYRFGQGMSQKKVVKIKMEMATHDLATEIKERRKNNQNFSVNEILQILAQCLDALIFLEKRQMSHRDIKPHNILLFKGLNLKLGDFGISQQYETCCSENLIEGTADYMSPELYSARFCQKKIKVCLKKNDIFPLGMCILQIATMKDSNDIKGMNITEKDGEKKIQDAISEVPEQIKDLINSMLQHQPTKRVNLMELQQQCKKVINQVDTSLLKHLSFKYDSIQQKWNKIEEVLTRNTQYNDTQ